MSGVTDPRLENLWISISLRTVRLAAQRLNVPAWELAEEIARKAGEPETQAVQIADAEVEMERIFSLFEAELAQLRRESTRDRSQKLDHILSRLPSYSDENLAADIAEIAHAEVTEEDPLSARRVVPEDVHGVGAAFGHRVERRPL